MISYSVSRLGNPVEHYGFLVVDEFLQTLPLVRALKTALELRVIDRLIAQGAGSVSALGQMVGLDQQGIQMLLDLLQLAGMVSLRNGDVRLTRRFRQALEYRDLLEAKLDYIGLCVVDFGDLFTTLVRGEGEFRSKARLFDLFDYHRCFGQDIGNYAHTRKWVKITSTLTRYESAACLNTYDIGIHRRMLDVGGNSGELALQFCRRNEKLTAMVFDLPVVCDVGLSHILAFPEHSRVSFIRGDLRTDPLYGDPDLITFKSILHDWPLSDRKKFLEKAFAVLQPGGTVLIFERAKLNIGQKSDAMYMLPNLLFFRYYRNSHEYIELLDAVGFEEIVNTDISLDSTYFVITARKPNL